MGSFFMGNLYYSTLSDFVVVTTLSIIFMWVCEYKYIWMQVWIYVVMFVLPRSHNPRQRYFNNEAFQLIQKDPDIVSQEISLFGAYGKFGWSLPQKRIFFKTFYHDDAQIYQISVHGQVEISPCEGNCKFCYRRNFLLGSGLKRDAFDYSNLFQS